MADPIHNTMEVGIYEGGEFIYGDHLGAVDSQTSLPEMGWEALPEIGWDEDLTQDSQFQINGAQARSSIENFQSLLPGSTEFQYTLLMENDPLSPHDLHNEDPSERRSEPYLCSEDFSTNFLALRVKITMKTPHTLAVILNLPETGIAKDAALAPFVGIVKAISYSAIRVMGHIIYFVPVLVLLLIKIKIGITQIASKGLSRLLEEGET